MYLKYVSIIGTRLLMYPKHSMDIIESDMPELQMFLCSKRDIDVLSLELITGTGHIPIGFYDTDMTLSQNSTWDAISSQLIMKQELTLDQNQISNSQLLGMCSTGLDFMQTFLKLKEIVPCTLQFLLHFLKCRVKEVQLFFQ